MACNCLLKRPRTCPLRTLTLTTLSAWEVLCPEVYQDILLALSDLSQMPALQKDLPRSATSNTESHSHQPTPQFSSVSRVQLFVTPRTAARQASLSITNSQRLFKLMSVELMRPSNHLILCCPLLLLPSIFPSIRVFSNMSVLCIRWPKYWSFSFNISPSNEYSGLISLEDELFGSPFSPRDSQESSPTPQFKSIKSLSLNFLYRPTLTPIHDYWKSHSFDQVDFVGKVKSLLFNKLSKFVITFLPRSKHLLISWLKSPSAVILEPKKIVCHCFHCFSIYLP